MRASACLLMREVGQ